jgi:hypothetical protein
MVLEEVLNLAHHDGRARGYLQRERETVLLGSAVGFYSLAMVKA